jgi:4-amino-4-deoxy-L-arabinose transferase-like glycosyltransferase
MFLWLLIFDQWKRLRPLHLPTGLLLFFAIAVPWHVLAAMHNETWAHRYFVFEHWQRFSSTAASREGPWYYYIGIVLAGLIPWVGFLWTGLREACRGGWLARAKNADAWFLAVWAGFIFLFFTKAHSKLPPYILPIFPALAVFIGAGLAKAWGEREVAPLRIGLRVFSFACGLLAVALGVVILRPALVKMPVEQALMLRPPVFTVAAVLLLGGIFVPWLGKVRGGRAAIIGIFAMMVLFFGALQFISPTDVKPGTKRLAEYVRTHAEPGDRVMHYHEFFHDFTFYARRVVDVVAFKGELELEEDAAARASGRFIDEPEFRARWTQPGRIFAVARKRDIKELFGDPTFRYRLLEETRDHYLFSNQP